MPQKKAEGGQYLLAGIKLIRTICDAMDSNYRGRNIISPFISINSHRRPPDFHWNIAHGRPHLSVMPRTVIFPTRLLREKYRHTNYKRRPCDHIQNQAV